MFESLFEVGLFSDTLAMKDEAIKALQKENSVIWSSIFCCAECTLGRRAKSTYGLWRVEDESKSKAVRC